MLDKAEVRPPCRVVAGDAVAFARVQSRSRLVCVGRRQQMAETSRCLVAEGMSVGGVDQAKPGSRRRPIAGGGHRSARPGIEGTRRTGGCGQGR